MTTPTTNLPPSLSDLQEILNTYDEVLHRLHSSHERLESEVTRLREQLEQKNKELEMKKRLAALGEMAAGIAHEIRNPLGGIQLYASTLASEVADRPLAAQLVQKISLGVKGLNSLVTDMLTFTQNITPNRQPTDLLELLASAIDYATPTLLQHNIDIDLGGGGDSLENLTLDLDPKLLRQVLLNLILNAAEALAEAKTPNGKITISVNREVSSFQFPVSRNEQDHPSRDRKGAVVEEGGELSTKDLALRTKDSSGNWKLETGNFPLSLIIEDNGPGIPPEHLDKIFNPFFTTKHTGTGLGLAIVHRIIEAHHATISVENKPQGGARFSIAF